MLATVKDMMTKMVMTVYSVSLNTLSKLLKRT